MGYTHYYGFTCESAEIEKGSFKKAVALFKKCLAKCPKTYVTEIWDKETQNYKETELPFVLKNGIGEGEATIGEKCIKFNGDASVGLDHETFFLDDTCQSEFCKTARKPYDLAVCLCLLSFKKVFGDKFRYSSDGITRDFVEKVKNGEKEWKKEWGKCEVEAEWQSAYNVFDKVVAEEV